MTKLSMNLELEGASINALFFTSHYSERLDLR